MAKGNQTQLVAQSTEELTEQLQEIQYEGTCYGEPCFDVANSKLPAGTGLCRKGCCESEALISVDLAKRQMLCDYQVAVKKPNLEQGETKKRRK